MAKSINVKYNKKMIHTAHFFLDKNYSIHINSFDLSIWDSINRNEQKTRRYMMPNTNADQQNEAAIVHGWSRFAEEYQARKLNENEQVQAERANLSEAQAKKTPFKLGNPIRSGL